MDCRTQGRQAPADDVLLREGPDLGKRQLSNQWGPRKIITLATGNVGRPGGGCVRMGGHQEGYERPSDAHVGKPAAYVDQLLIGGKGGIHHIWACDHFKTTLNALEFKKAYKRRTDLVKYAMEGVPYGDREALVNAVMDAIRKGGLFSVDVDIIPTRKIGECAHVVLPAATSGEINLTSMNGERRMRLTERYMDPPGNARPDCLIVAGLAQALERSWRAAGKNDVADKFKGYDWKTEEDAFMDGYNKNADGGKFVTYERLRAMGTNGFQEPAVDFKDGKIVGTKRLYTDGKFKEGKAKFMGTQWRGLQAEGKQAEKDKFPFLINNGRANHVWQSVYLDQNNDFVMDRFPLPYIQMNPDDMKELRISAGDLVEVYNDNGSTQAMAYPTPTAKRKQSFMLFAYPTGPQGNVVSKGVNQLVIPNYKQTSGDIPKNCGCARGYAQAHIQGPGISHGLMVAATWRSTTCSRRPPDFSRRGRLQLARPDDHERRQRHCHQHCDDKEGQSPGGERHAAREIESSADRERPDEAASIAQYRMHGERSPAPRRFCRARRTLAQLLRRSVLSHGGVVGLGALLARLQPILSLVSLLTTLVLLFGFQGEQILSQPLIIALLAVPILIQVYFNSGLAYLLKRAAGEAHCVAAPSALIGATNFFELAVAAAISLFGF